MKVPIVITFCPKQNHFIDFLFAFGSDANQQFEWFSALNYDGPNNSIDISGKKLIIRNLSMKVEVD